MLKKPCAWWRRPMGGALHRTFNRKAVLERERSDKATSVAQLLGLQDGLLEEFQKHVRTIVPIL